MALQPIGLDATITGVPDFTAGINKMNAGVDSFAQNSTKQGGMFAGGFGEIVTGALRKIGELGVQALMQAGRAVAGFVKDSIGLAGDFEANMLQFQSVAGKEVDTAGLEKFRDLFLDIGKRLPVSTSEVQQAAIEMVKGGIDPAIIAAGGLEKNIQFAAAAMDGDLVKAAEISSKILGGWTDANATAAEKADFLAHSQDMLAKAANASATDVEGLSRGIFQSQGIAKTAGVSFDDLTTTLALLAPRFASSAEAGTSVKNMIARLQPTTDPATQAMKQLGLYTDETGSAFYDAAGNFVGFETASQLLQTSLKDLTKEQQAAALQTIFGNDAMGAAAALADGGSAAYANMAKNLLEANGVAEAAALKQQGFNTALDNAKGSVEALQITIGSALLPVMTDLMDNVAKAVNTLTDFASALFGSDEAFSRLSPTMQSFAMILIDLSSYFTAVAEDGDYLNDFLDSLPGPIQGVVGGIGMLAAAFGPLQEYINAVVEDGDYLNDFLTDIPDPMQGVVQAAGMLVAAFQSTNDESSALGGALDQLNGVWELALQVVQDVGDGYMAVAEAVLPVVTAFWTEHGEEVLAFVQTTYDTLIAIITTALELYDAIVPPILNAIASFIEAHGSEITKILSGAWEMISSLITGALQTIQAVIQLALDLIHGDWSAAWTDIGTIVDVQAKAIGGIVSGFLDMIAGLFNTSMADIAQTWADNWAMLVDIVTETDWVAAGSSVVEGIIAGVQGMASELFAALEQMAQDAYDAFMKKIAGGSPAQEFVPAGASVVEGILVGMQSMVPELMDLINQTGTDMINALTKNIDEGGDAIRAKMDALIADVKDISSQIQSAIGDAFGATASINRQKVTNMKGVAGISKTQRERVQQDINTAEQVASRMTDPQKAAEYFKMQSQHLIELAKLRDQVDKEVDPAAREALIAQYVLVAKAQKAEEEALKANAAARADPNQKIEAMMQKLLLNEALPGLLENPVMAQLFAMLQQLAGAVHRAAGGPVGAGRPYWVGENGPELFMPKLAGMIMPMSGQVGSSARQSAPVTNNNYYGQVGSSLTMPVYTNNSPSAIQSSMAIAGAALL